LGLLFWQVKYNKPKDSITNLSKEDVKMLLGDAPPQQLQVFANSKEARQNVLRQIKEFLAFAAEARALGMVDAKTKSQLALTKAIVLSTVYQDKKAKGAGQNVGGPGVSPGLSKEEIDAYLKRPGIEDKFKKFVQEAQEVGQLPPGEMPEERVKVLKDQWGKVFLGEEKAIQESLDKERKTELQIAIQQAIFLTRLYSEKKLNKEALEATDAEIEAWIAAHPEYDPKAKRTRAEELLKRARGGEDFVKLVNENTEDPGNKKPDGALNGGFYEFARNMGYAKPFEDASFALQKPGDISDVVETEFGYHIIKLDNKIKKKGADGKEQEFVQVRHILVSTMVKDPKNPLDQGAPLKEKAKAEVEKNKREKYIDDLAKKHAIVVPDDFEVEVPAIQPDQQGDMPIGPGGPQGPPPQQQEEPETKQKDKKPETKSKTGGKKGK
jgi:parvulin-like peptidyl-prolyl isomerase